ncbi:hypothetical protein HDU85_005516 [Gaertneriomyces sp. JEL0708]|nr:hypothetical protein HDU85_005516 [Gaertneriomyces sp. JEL0708]
MSSTTSSTPEPTENPKYHVGDPSIGGAWVWFGIAVAVVIGCSLIYEAIRWKSGLQRILYTRASVNRRETPSIPTHLFGWFKPIWDIPESYIIENVGLDAVMFLRFLRMCFMITLILICTVLPILLPVNYLAPGSWPDGVDGASDSGSNLQFAKENMLRYSISNIPSKSDAFWAHLVCVYIVSGVTYYFLFISYRDYANLAAEYIHEKQGIMTKRTKEWRKAELVQLRTVLVQNIPATLQNDDKLKAWFEALGLGEVENAVVDRDAGSRVYRWTRLREKTLKKLERAYVHWLINIDKERTRRSGIRPSRWYSPGHLLRLHSANINISALGINDETLELLRPRRTIKQRTGTISGRTWKWAPGTDEIEYLTKKLHNLTVQLKQLRRMADGESDILYRDPRTSSATAAGFVTFKTQRSALLASQVLLHGSDSYWSMTVKLAPAPQDVLWTSISLPSWRRQMQSWSITLLTFFLVFFWTVPTSLVASMTTLESLAKVPALQGFIEDIAKSQQLYFLLKSIGPPIVVAIFNAIVPVILEQLSYQQGLEAHSSVELATMSKYFFFLFFNIFFVFTITVALFGVVNDFFKNPWSIVNDAVEQLPNASTFFINYIILNLMRFPAELLRPGIMIVALLGRYFMQTPRDFHGLTILSSFLNYGTLYPMHVLIFVLVICYAPIAPLVLLPGLVYFGLGWCVFKHQLLFVYVKEWESFGRHWVMAFKRATVGMGVMQVVLAGVLVAKDAQIPAGLCVPLVIFTIVFYIYCRKVFEKRTFLVPLEEFGARQTLDRTQMISQRPSSVDLPEVFEKVRSSESLESSTEALHSASVVDMPQISTFPAEVVTSAEQHALERYSTNYTNPLFSKPMSRPWLPVSMASWWGRLPKSILNEIRMNASTVPSEPTTEDRKKSRLKMKAFFKSDLSTRVKLLKPGVEACALAGAVGLAIGAPAKLSGAHIDVADIQGPQSADLLPHVPTLMSGHSGDEDDAEELEMQPVAVTKDGKVLQHTEAVAYVDENHDSNDVESGMPPSTSYAHLLSVASVDDD